jgi:proton glutamate symport protein
MSSVRFNWQILLALALALVSGLAARETAAFAGLTWVVFFDFFGALFVGALKMLVVPLVCASIIVAMAGFASTRALGRVGFRALVLYVSTAFVAVLLGMLATSVLRPGLVDGRPAATQVPLSSMSADLPEEIADKSLGDMLDSLLSIVPSNVIGAAAADDMLGLLFFSILFGWFLARLEADVAAPLQKFWSGVLEIMLRMTSWVMLFAPLGVFGLVAGAVAKADFAITGPVVAFAALVLAALGFHVAVVLPLVLVTVARVAPGVVYRATAPALVTAFASASSATALPVTLKCVEERLGVSSRVASLLLPAGASINLNGTALYQAMAAVFLTQVYGLDLDFSLYLTIAALAVATSVSLPGVPAASLTTLTVMLSAIGLPPEALGLLLVFDRLLDMARTAVNVAGDVVCAVTVARLEGEDCARS